MTELIDGRPRVTLIFGSRQAKREFVRGLQRRG